MKIKNEKGKEVEVFTQEELDKKLEENSEKISKTFEEKFDKLSEDFNKKIKEKSKSNDPEPSDPEPNDPDPKTGDDAIMDNMKKMQEQIDSMNKNNQEEFSKLVDSEVSKYAGDDKDLAEKLKFEFDSYRPDKNSVSDVPERMQAAAKIISQDNPSIMDNINNVNHGGGSSVDPEEGDDNKPSDNSKQIGKALGIKESDREKYSSEKYQEYMDGASPQ